MLMVRFAGVGGGGVPIWRTALELSNPTAAVMFTNMLTALALNVVVAMPHVAPGHAPVVAEAAVNDPAVTSLTVKFTVAPDTGVAPLSTVALTLVDPGVTGMDVGVHDTEIDVGTRGGVPIVSVAPPGIVVVP